MRARSKPEKDPEHHVLQAKVDKMTGEQADKYLRMLERRAKTSMHKMNAKAFPIWGALLKGKVKKLAEKAAYARTKSLERAWLARQVITGLAVKI